MKKIVANKKADFIITCLILGFGFGVSILFKLKPLSGAFFYLFLPSLYLILREKKNFWKIFWGVVVFGFIVGFAFDLVQTFNKSWIMTGLVFPWKFFGLLPLDNIIGWGLMALFILVFYEHFLDDEKNKKISKNLKWAILVFLAGLFIGVGLYLIFPALIKLPYAYLIGGIIAIIFPLIFSARKKLFLEKALKLSAFFFFVWLFAELICLKYGGWIFPGQYIGTVSLFGLSFPFEELFFWMMCYSATVASYYEFFIDDKK
jgi:hypothetical protein